MTNRHYLRWLFPFFFFCIKKKKLNQPDFRFTELDHRVISIFVHPLIGWEDLKSCNLQNRWWRRTIVGHDYLLYILFYLENKYKSNGWIPFVHFQHFFLNIQLLYIYVFFSKLQICPPLCWGREKFVVRDECSTVKFLLWWNVLPTILGWIPYFVVSESFIFWVSSVSFGVCQLFCLKGRFTSKSFQMKVCLRICTIKCSTTWPRVSSTSREVLNRCRSFHSCTAAAMFSLAKEG